MASSAPASRAASPALTELFTPKLITVLREGYGLADLRADILAGLTVAIVALPLSMAIAIASGTTPERGLFTAAVGGFLISALGGSRFQIGGPAAAFTVLVASTISRHGLDGLLLATIMSGMFLLLMGVFRLGSYIKFIPYPVTVGFISGIAVILFVGQIHDLLGLTLPGADPADILPKLATLAAAIGTTNPTALGIAALAVGVIIGLRRWRPHWPGILIAVIAASLAGALLQLPVETIGTRFGGIPSTLPSPALPPFSLDKVQAVLPDAVAFALLGAIESLLSAMVADGMTGRRHRSNMELVAQGIANVGSALFGGICATGTVARTATNVRSGARSPLAGMFHSVFIVLFMLVAAPLASFIPLAALAGVLVVVAWNMAEKTAFATLLRTSPGDAVVLLATFGLTVFRGLTEGIVIGFALGALLFIHRMAQHAGVEVHAPPVPEDQADAAGATRLPYDPAIATDPDVAVYRITGAFFFGAAATVGSVLERIADQHRAFVVDFSAVPFIDSTAANTMGGIARKAARHHVVLLISGATPAVRKSLTTHGVSGPTVLYERTVEAAIGAAHAEIARRSAPEVIAPA
ncbi:SulP family sulfate transporter [Devosia sp. Root413D1]|uniref:SulP family inorganic anion transporter n=1 Tax=unclassified Devosia TaxID=196773 RepID=UPI0006F60DCE|nr:MULTISPECIES: SulP family inorganic anion transporter [unclassified Devosia]KQU99057.1 SulP family sulfate transporter [Devosia sp. Root105]KQW81350.1 SulP family sulfate transporter [Devosia sp. Root413D1]